MTRNPAQRTIPLKAVKANLPQHNPFQVAPQGYTGEINLFGHWALDIGLCAMTDFTLKSLHTFVGNSLLNHTLALILYNTVEFLLLGALGDLHHVRITQDRPLDY